MTTSKRGYAPSDLAIVIALLVTFTGSRAAESDFRRALDTVWLTLGDGLAYRADSVDAWYVYVERNSDSPQGGPRTMLVSEEPRTVIGGQYQVVLTGERLVVVKRGGSEGTGSLRYVRGQDGEVITADWKLAQRLKGASRRSVISSDQVFLFDPLSPESLWHHIGLGRVREWRSPVREHDTTWFEGLGDPDASEMKTRVGVQYNEQIGMRLPIAVERTWAGKPLSTVTLKWHVSRVGGAEVAIPVEVLKTTYEVVDSRPGPRPTLRSRFVLEVESILHQGKGVSAKSTESDLFALLHRPAVELTSEFTGISEGEEGGAAGALQWLLILLSVFVVAGVWLWVRRVQQNA